jgi:hypothetical protein
VGSLKPRQNAPAALKGTTMNKRLMITTAAAILAANMAFGQSQQDSILSQLMDQGYSNIEIKVGATTIKVEAVRDGMKREFTVDISTGAVSNDHTQPVGSGDSGMTPIGGDDSSSDDSSGHDSNDDNEDSSDDNSSRGGSNGGSHDNGSDSEDDD